MFCHSSESEQATTATTGSVSLRLKTSCGTPGKAQKVLLNRLGVTLPNDYDVS